MRNAVVGVVCCTLLCACSSPVGPIAGRALEGTPVPWPESWEFTDDVENVLLETNPNDPYSVTIWCARVEDNLYIAASDEDNQWVVNMMNDPRVILSVEGKLIQGRTSVVTSNEEIRRVIQAYLTKYEIDNEENFVEEEGVLFRFNPR